MAEHLNSAKQHEELSGFNLMGHPISMERRQRGYDSCRAMGLSPDLARACAGGMVEQLERDKPYEGHKHAMQYLDLTGTYRLMAEILA